MDWASVIIEISKIVLTVILTSLASYVVYKKFTKRKALAIYSSRPIPVIPFKTFKRKGLTEKIKILYNGEPLSENLYASRITIKNAGNDVISVGDLDRKGIIFEIACEKGNPNLKILDLEILGCPRTSDIQVDIKNNHEIHIQNFDFLNPEEKIELRILFTGEENIKIEPLFRIKGGKLLKAPPQKRITQIHDLLLTAMIIVLILLIASMGFMLIKGPSEGIEYATKYFTDFFALIISLTIISALLRFFEEMNIQTQREVKET